MKGSSVLPGNRLKKTVCYQKRDGREQCATRKGMEGSRVLPGKRWKGAVATRKEIEGSSALPGKRWKEAVCYQERD